MKYSDLDMEIVLFDAEDVITTSGGTAQDDCPPVKEICDPQNGCTIVATKGN